MVDDTLLQLNKAVGQDLVVGENQDHAAEHLAMRSTVISQDYISLQGGAGLSIAAPKSHSSGLESGAQPSMLLPSTMNLSSEVTIATINYGKHNPYLISGGELDGSASINSFTFNGLEVSDLDDPIVLALPLMSSSRRRLMRERAKAYGREELKPSP